MSNLPKIVVERLRSGPQEGAGDPTPLSGALGAAAPDAHPDPDLLSAFFEQALLPAEREQILEHLAACADCRTAMIVALPPLESVAVTRAVAESEATVVSPPSRRSWFRWPVVAWPKLRWGALAAGVAGVVVAGTLLLQHSDNFKVPVASKQAETKLAIEKGADQPSKPPTPGTANTIFAGRDATPAELKAREIATRSGKDIAANNKVLEKGKVAQGGSKSISDRELSRQDYRFANDKLASVTAASPVSQPQASKTLASETSAVGGAAGAVSQSEMGRLVARNEAVTPPVIRAKPPTAAEQGAPMQKAAVLAKKEDSGVRSRAFAYSLDSPTAPVQWSVSAGMLRRSRDGGVTWQTALPDSHLLCYAAADSDVWTAGRSGVLYHSADHCATWIQLHPSIGDRPLSNDVTHIELRGTGELILTTSNGETWTSPDNGKTWASK